MSVIALNVSFLPTLAQLAKGADVLAKTTNNPLLAGLADELAEFGTAQQGLATASAEAEAAKTTCKAKTAARVAAQKTWKAKYKALATKAEAAAEGAPEAILSGGFDLKAEATPAQELEAPANFVARLNGTAGVTKLSWDSLAGAVSYLVQETDTPDDEGSWETVATPTKSSCAVDGAEPGKKRWYRVAGVNSMDTRTWSVAVSRPVL